MGSQPVELMDREYQDQLGKQMVDILFILSCVLSHVRSSIFERVVLVLGELLQHRRNSLLLGSCCGFPRVRHSSRYVQVRPLLLHFVFTGITSSVFK